MTVRSRITILVEHLQHAIVLLEQLHVLSQTEALVLESSNLAELEPVVKAKESLISQMDQDQRLLVAALAQPVPSSAKGPAESRESLDVLKERALQLVGLIGAVDNTNRIQLERFKAEAVHSAQILQQDQKLRGAYGNSDPLLSQFSRLAD